MEDMEKKLTDFTRSIIDEARQEASAIIEKVKEARKAAIKRAEEDIKLETQMYESAKISEIRTRESQKVINRMMENHHRRLGAREEYAAAIYEIVRKKIETVTQSGEYVDLLKRYLNSALSQFSSAGATVYLRYADMFHAQELEKSAPGYKITFRPGDIHLGGLVLNCPEKHLRIDLSFDAALSECEGHFAELSGMDLAESD